MIDAVIGLVCGLLVGAGAAAVVSRWAVRRSVLRVKAAERRARAAERLAEVGAMTGGLAHEIKNPLSTIGLNAQLLQESIEELAVDADEKGRLTRRIGTLRREVERLRGILTDFLEFAGELRLDRKPADVGQIADELVDFFHPQAERQGVRLRLDRGGAPLTASVDVPHLKQALLNLMLNAVQAMTPQDNGGRPKELMLRVSPRVEPDKTRMVAVHVTDTGPGIPPQAMEKLFKPYFTTKSGGTGLGLPTSRRIAEAHGGRIEVHTEPGRGTDFVILLPA